MPTLTPRRRRLRRAVFSSGLLSVGLVAGWWATRDRAQPYVPGHETEDITRSLDRRLPGGRNPLRMSETAAAAGIVEPHFSGQRTSQLPEDMGSGAAWADIDGDGDLDLYVANLAAPLPPDGVLRFERGAPHRLYRNDGGGRFTEIAAAAGVARRALGMGVAFGDYDNDGDPDLLASAYGTLALYRNRGDGSFDDVSEASGVGAGEPFYGSGVAWADYDRDGDLDFYACAYVDYRGDPAARQRSSLQYGAAQPFTLNPSSYPPQPNRLYRNRGDGRFEEVARRAGVDNPMGRSLTAAWCDFDADGWPDLYVANDVSDNALFRNRGDGSFEDISYAAAVADYRGAMGIAVADLEGDEDFDMFVSHWIAQENALYVNLRSDDRGAGRSDAPLMFVDSADSVGLGQIALSDIGWGSVFFDPDNDGRSDLFVANGSTFEDSADRSRLKAMKHRLFWNAGAEGFFDVAEPSCAALAEPQVGRGVAAADYDADGDVDLFVLHHSGRPYLLRSEAPAANGWLKLRLQGTRSNRDAIGARVELRAGERRWIQMVGASPSYLSQSAYELNFGLGAAAGVDAIEITWPSGTVQTLGATPARQTLKIVEPAD
ncbi:MAG TPA: CRTAC1 family protein [Acidobacteriota bacterium]